MSKVKKVIIKLGPLIKREDDEFMPMQLTVDGESILWIEKELKKETDNTFVHEFSFRAENKDINNASTSTIDIQKESESLDNVKNAENEVRIEIAGPSHIDKTASASTRSSDSGEGIPALLQTLEHSEVVKTVAVQDEWILTGSRDGLLNMWTIDGKHHLTIPAHQDPVEDVAWISKDKNSARFVSVSKDFSVTIWEWNIAENTVDSSECVYARSEEQRCWFGTVSVNYDKTVLACGGWDGKLNCWAAYPRAQHPYPAPKNKIRLLIKTLKEHRDLITGVVWTENNEIVSCALDNRAIVWDYATGKRKHVFIDHDAFYNVDYSQLRRSILVSGFDNIRLFDLRESAGTKLNTLLMNRKKVPANTIKWSTSNENLFITGDMQIEVWDVRNPLSPLFELVGHKRKVLCSDWSNPKYMLFGGEDKMVRIFEAPSRSH